MPGGNEWIKTVGTLRARTPKGAPIVPVRLIIVLGLVFGWVGLLIQGLRWTLVIGAALLLVGAVTGASARSDDHGRGPDRMRSGASRRC